MSERENRQLLALECKSPTTSRFSRLDSFKQITLPTRRNRAKHHNGADTARRKFCTFASNRRQAIHRSTITAPPVLTDLILMRLIPISRIFIANQFGPFPDRSSSIDVRDRGCLRVLIGRSHSFGFNNFSYLHCK
jgi:hypothetical protein